MSAPPPAPESVDAHISRGLIRQQAGDWSAALDCFQQAAQLDPARAPLYLYIGNAFSRLGNWAAARENYQRAIDADPGFADAYNNLGLALLATGREREAIAAFAKAIEHNSHHANAYFNLGKMCTRRKQFAAAASMLRHALAIEPQHPYALHELGRVHEKCGQLEQAIALYRRSMELDPTRTIRGNLAATRALMGDPDGVAQQEKLVREQPDDAEAHWNLGIGLLLHGRYTEGWREFEWRTQIPRFRKQHYRFDKPRWKGERLDGKTLLLFGEQGHGDTLQFLRYVPLAAARCARIVLDVPPLLQSLLKTFPGIAACTALKEPKPDFDAYASLMSLPHLLQPQPIPSPAVIPVATSSEMINRASRSRLQVGLAWAGSPKQKRDHLRSIPLAQWNGLTSIDSVDFTALQMGPPSPNAPSAGHAFQFVQDCADAEDFAALAAVVAQLDLVITIDSAVAHLAGTMGKPVWILLPNTVDWRWGFRGTTTDWYPTARLFRQTTPADWSGVMADVAKELAVLARK